MDKTYVCLFDLTTYDRKVAPALRQYVRDYQPQAVVALLKEVQTLLPVLKQNPDRPLPETEDCEHWVVSIEPDAGYKPSEQTVKDLCNLLVQPLCVPHDTAFNPMQELDRFSPWLSDRSEWFADLMDGGEELAGGRLEFSFGSGSLIATRAQIHQFRQEVENIQPPGEGTEGLDAEFRNLLQVLVAADSRQDYTLLKTTLKSEKK